VSPLNFATPFATLFRSETLCNERKSNISTSPYLHQGEGRSQAPRASFRGAAPNLEGYYALAIDFSQGG